MFASESQAEAKPPRSPATPLKGWKDIVEPVDPFLNRVAARLSEQFQAFEPEIAQFAQYVLSNQGKQLRPALVGLSGGSPGEPEESLVSVAVIIEMVHLATLVHDDVMDAAEIRRGKPTAAAQWGNEISVLLGDCLFAHSLELAASFPTPEICRAVSATTNAICSGEILQTLSRRNFLLTRKEYFRAVELKTAELFALSCDLGAAVSGTTETEQAALRQFGRSLGTSYQIYDDCLDLFGSESHAGKSLGTDLASGKFTLPVLLFLEQAGPEDRLQFQSLLDEPGPLSLGKIVEFLNKYETLDQSKQVIGQYLTASRQPLERLAEPGRRETLWAITEFLAQQTENLGV